MRNTYKNISNCACWFVQCKLCSVTQIKKTFFRRRIVVYQLSYKVVTIYIYNI